MDIQLDEFQQQAIEWVEKQRSVFVAAPTGSGKTVIEEAVIEKAIAHQEQVIYTSPIKALSNQKYRDFKNRYGESSTGILTGDVSINSDAPILIMTTEIYRNSLFENPERIQNIGWVIFDEIHYLDDPERGTVWEEAILFTPAHIQILALSATIPNVRELAEWIQFIHNRPLVVVEESRRPVPLHFLFQCQGEVMTSMKQLRAEGYLHHDNWRLSRRQVRRGFRTMRAKPNRLDHLIRHMISKQHTPIIYFVFGRRQAEFLAGEAARFDFLSDDERKQILSLYESLVERYGLTGEKSAENLRSLVELGIAYHHAGMLPSLKEVVEQLFTSRLIKIIFTTETFALGINMPARSVVFDCMEKFYGTGFRYLTSRDFYQMAGRAGRRGMDREGYVYARLHPLDISFHEVERILYGKPEPIRSQLNTSYATLLNLYRDLGPKLIDLYPKTFHYFQSSEKNRKEGLHLIKRKLAFLAELGYIAAETLTAKGNFARSIFGYELLLSEIYENGLLLNVPPLDLNILLSALVFEPRKGDELPRLNPKAERLRKTLDHFARLIHHGEHDHRIYPYTKPPHFHLAGVVEMWTNGADFDRMAKSTRADEGELVRHFRMIIQLLRALAHAPGIPGTLRPICQQARDLINRDVVDAEKQLRMV